MYLDLHAFCDWVSRHLHAGWVVQSASGVVVDCDSAELVSTKTSLDMRSKSGVTLSWLPLLAKVTDHWTAENEGETLCAHQHWV